MEVPLKVAKGWPGLELERSELREYSPLMEAHLDRVEAKLLKSPMRITTRPNVQLSEGRIYQAEVGFYSWIGIGQDVPTWYGVPWRYHDLYDR